MAKAERAFIYGVKQGGVSLAKSIQNQDPARFVLAGFISDIAEIEYRYLMGVKVYPNDEEFGFCDGGKNGLMSCWVSPIES